MGSDSAQKHWLQSNGVLGHTHVDLDTINKPDVASVLVVNFAIHLFRVTGQVSSIYAGNYKTNDAFDWFWDATKSATPPPLVGNPDDEVVYTGHFSVKPAIPHGYAWVSMSVYTAFINAGTKKVERTSIVMLNEPYHSVVDISVPPLNDLDPSAQRSQAVGRMSPPLLPNGENDNSAPFYGEETVQIDTAFPRGPFDKTQDLTSSTYGYGARGMPEAAICDVVLDADLHHDIPGTVLYKFSEPTASGLIHAPTPWVPSVIGPGDHKLMVRRTIQNGDELSAVLFVTHITVGDVIPPVLVPVPNVVGMSQADAVAALTAVGLGQHASQATSTVPEGTVTTQDPLPGVQVPQGSIVSIVVSSGSSTDRWTPTTDTVVVEKFGAQDKYRLNVKGHTVDLS